ncbi:short chain oxidoreductase [Daedaleopsis nitida]|nr:short chain oxidoreductase [Daedaleopsis nitida]
MAHNQDSPRRVAIITGASQGIGRAIALRLAKDGMNLGLFDLPRCRDALEELSGDIERDFGAKVVTVYGDVSVEEDIKGLIDTVVQELGQLYAMIANAGIAIRPRPVHEISTEEYDNMMNVNTKAVFFCYKYTAIRLIEQGTGGRMIGATSLAGKNGMAGMAPYCASKFAVRALTQVAALDYGKYGITVNAYAPGYIQTPMVQKVLEESASASNAGGVVGKESDHETSFQALVTSMENSNCLKRAGQPDDIANLVSFLVSDQASFITGESLHYPNHPVL